MNNLLKEYFHSEYPKYFAQNKNTVLMSIKPKFANKILSHEKKVEYRKTNFSKKIDNIIMYSSSPTKLILGIIEVEDVIIDFKEEIWYKTKEISGIEKTFFDTYYSKYKLATAIMIRNVIQFNHSINPVDIDSEYIAPQSYFYL